MIGLADTAPGPAGPAAEGPQDAAAAAKGLYFVRRVTAMRDFEVFFVSSVATIRPVRSILAAGWPDLGGGKIHFASTAIRLQDASSGGAHGTHQV